MKYLLALFTRETWGEFLSNGSRVYGVVEQKEGAAYNVFPHDRLVCYVTLPHSAFAGIVEITSRSYYDTTRLWSDGVYPIRFDVIPIVALEVDSFVPAQSLRNELSVLKKLPRNKPWWGFFRGSLVKFPPGDGEHIEKVLTEAAARSHRRP